MPSRSHRLFRRFFLVVIALLALPLGLALVWRALPAGRHATAQQRCMTRGWLGTDISLDWAPATALQPVDRQARATFCAADLEWHRQPAQRPSALAAMMRAQAATGTATDRSGMALAIGRRLLDTRPQLALTWFERAVAAADTPQTQEDRLAQAVAWIDPARHPALAAPLQQQLLAVSLRTGPPLAQIDALEALAATRARLGDTADAARLYAQARARVTPRLWAGPGQPQGDPALAAKWQARLAAEQAAGSLR